MWNNNNNTTSKNFNNDDKSKILKHFNGLMDKI